MQIAKRITEQYSNLRKSLYTTKHPAKNKSAEKKTVYAGWNYSPIKDRKLPKLVHSSTK